MIQSIIMVLIIAFVPAVMIKAAKQNAALNKLGTVFLCYAAGIVLSFPMKAMGAQLTLASDVSSLLVCVAMPLILFSADLPALKNLARPMLCSFGLNAVSVIAVAGLSFFIFRSIVPEAAKVCAMLIGTYTGGTPNMFAIGHGLGASAETMLLVQTSDMIAGGIYFFLLISVLPGFLKKYMPEYQGAALGENAPGQEHVYGGSEEKPGLYNYLFGIAFACMCAVAAMAVCIMIPSKYGNTGLSKLGEHTALIMLLVTSFGIALSFQPKLRRCPGTYQSGQYCILMFSAAMGLCFDISSISGGALLIFFALMVIQFGTAALHMLLAKLCRIDYHTAMITSTAGVFGPAFIIPVAKALKNDAIILPGIICGILGYAVGNYLGIGFGELLMLTGG